MDLASAKAVISGGASGLGLATAQRIIKAGGHVTLLDINDEQGAASAADLGERASYINTDVANEESVQKAMAAANDFMGGITLAVNCAGIATAGRTLGRDGPWPSELRNILHSASGNDPDHWERLRAALAHDWAEHVDFLSTGLGAVTMPVEIVHGANDLIVLPEQAERLVAALPDARLRMVPDAGHQVHREQPEAFLEVLRETIASIR